jgi:hypothetical protein
LSLPTSVELFVDGNVVSSFFDLAVDADLVRALYHIRRVRWNEGLDAQMVLWNGFHPLAPIADEALRSLGVVGADFFRFETCDHYEGIVIAGYFHLKTCGVVFKKVAVAKTADGFNIVEPAS